MFRSTDIFSLQTVLQPWRDAGERIAFVPTMGNLHEGHLRLVDLALAHADRCVVSIFVNPTQFGPGEDFARYPRTVETDCEKLQQRGADVVFLPSVEVLYGEHAEADIQVPAELGDKLCGASRPGHFDGVASVVSKLFAAVRPDTAVFGEKDYQQLRVIEWLVADQQLPVSIIAAPIVREQDGLAMSSRNQYLSAAERQQATQLYRALQTIAGQLMAGQRNDARLCREASQQLSAAGWQVDYIELLNAGLQPATENDTDLVILAAASLGNTRLIDNLRCQIAP